MVLRCMKTFDQSWGDSCLPLLVVAKSLEIMRNGEEGREIRAERLRGPGDMLLVFYVEDGGLAPANILILDLARIQLIYTYINIV